VHRLRDHAVPARVVHRRNLGAVRAEVARIVRRKAAGNDQRRAAARALRVERREPLHAVGPRLEAGVHRAHQDAVG
jgi:hypothetical protein